MPKDLALQIIQKQLLFSAQSYLYSFSQRGHQSYCLILSFSRSPWSNTYDPPLDDGAMPSERLRKLEIEANQAFDQYRNMWV